MGDIGPVRRHFEVLAGADLAGPSLERLAQVAGRDAHPRSSDAHPPTGAASAGDRDDGAAD